MLKIHIIRRMNWTKNFSGTCINKYQAVDIYLSIFNCCNQLSIRRNRCCQISRFIRNSLDCIVPDIQKFNNWIFPVCPPCIRLGFNPYKFTSSVWNEPGINIAWYVNPGFLPLNRIYQYEWGWRGKRGFYCDYTIRTCINGWIVIYIFRMFFRICNLIINWLNSRDIVCPKSM